MNKHILLIISLIFSLDIFAQKADYSKMSSLVRSLARESYGVSLAKGYRANSSRCVIAFVRTNSKDVLEKNGCKDLASWGDIHIAKIPLCNLNALSNEKEVKRIEAGKCCSATVDTTRYIINVAPLQYDCAYPLIPDLSLASHTGKGVVVGVQDIGFDLTHPNFWSQDGQTYRIKAMWDMIARDSLYKGSLPVGVDYTSQEDILNHAHSADGFVISHGTHTSGIAAGSGWDGSKATKYIGIAPDADICLVSNFTTSAKDLVSKEELEIYTNAVDILGFKYIFDYAKSVGKPCVINFSEGAHEDLYECKMLYESLDSLIGPGRIICSASGNEGVNYSYIDKERGRDSLTTFLYSGSSTSYSLMRSDKEFGLTLRFYKSKEFYTKDYNFNDIIQCEDSTLIDTLDIYDHKYVVLLCAYPTCYNDGRWALEFAVENITEGSSKSVGGSSSPISLTIKGKDTEVEMFANTGSLIKNTSIDPVSVQGEVNHNVLFPSTSKSVISVGATAYLTGHTNYLGKWMSSDNGTKGVLTFYSSTGPTLQGLTKPNVVAPGQNVISSFSSYYHEKNPDANDVKWDVERFDYNGRTYSWTSSSGTSMACPVVAGIVALWLEECPTLTTDQIIDVIAHTSTHYDESLSYPNNQYGWGQIDAKAGIDYIDKVYTGIENIKANKGINKNPLRPGIYDMSGRKTEYSSLSHGVFVVVCDDGTVKKVIK